MVGLYDWAHGHHYIYSLLSAHAIQSPSLSPRISQLPTPYAQGLYSDAAAQVLAPTHSTLRIEVFI